MSFDPVDSLRNAGVLRGPKPQAVEEIFGSLSKEEVDFLITLKSRVAAAIAPDVLAQSRDSEEDMPCVMGQTVKIE